MYINFFKPVFFFIVKLFQKQDIPSKYKAIVWKNIVIGNVNLVKLPLRLRLFFQIYTTEKNAFHTNYLFEQTFFVSFFISTIFLEVVGLGN